MQGNVIYPNRQKYAPPKVQEVYDCTDTFVSGGHESDGLAKGYETSTDWKGVQDAGVMIPLPLLPRPDMTKGLAQKR